MTACRGRYAFLVRGNNVEWWYSAEHDGDVVVPASFPGEGDQRIRVPARVRERGSTGQSA
jgi:hypothetical protein